VLASETELSDVNSLCDVASVISVDSEKPSDELLTLNEDKSLWELSDSQKLALVAELSDETTVESVELLPIE
jgi:hypothetical protein